MSMKENRGIPVGISSVSKTGMPTGTLKNSPDTNSKQIKVRENKKKSVEKKSAHETGRRCLTQILKSHCHSMFTIKSD